MSKSHIAWLSEYIQINTTAAAGNEEKALLYMKRLAEENGLFALYLPSAEQKGNLVIAIREDDLRPFQAASAAFGSPPIVLLSHVDVVEATASDWQHPPFSGAIADEAVWGRGAIDAKQIGMSHLMAMISLKEKSFKHHIIQLITCEEETGSENGLKAFLKQFPSYWKGALVLNEGGGFPIEVEGQSFYLVETGQKGNTSFTVTTSVRKAGNPYMPNQTAAANAIEIAERISSYQFPAEQLPASVQTMFSLIGKQIGLEASSSWREVIERFPQKYQRFFSALTKSTMTVTGFQGGKKLGELKGAYRLTVDARPLPNMNEIVFKTVVEKLVRDIDPLAVIEWHPAYQGYDHPLDESLRWLIEQNLKQKDSALSVVPFMTIGSNDGRYFEQAGATVLGYCPMLPEMTFDRVLPLVHGVDERIGIQDFEFGIEQLTAILEPLTEASILRR